VYFNLKSQFSRLRYWLTGKKTAFLSSAMDSLKHWDFFHQAPYLRLTLQDLIYSTFSILPSTSFNGYAILCTTTFCHFFQPGIQILILKFLLRNKMVDLCILYLLSLQIYWMPTLDKRLGSLNLL
jgi:hypothetical protein